MIDRLYALLEAKTGIVRKRDPRLEKIAADRALEARYEVGTTGTTPISHPINQLKARTFPLQGVQKLVLENAAWNYAFADPIQAIVDGWWNSAPHRANLLNADATTWGIGLYVEGDRHYAVTIFCRDLMTRAVVVSGTSFPDALGAGPLASRYGASIFLTGRTSLPVPTRDALVALKPSEIIVVGGTAVVDASVAAALSAIAPVRRVAGADRYATAVAVSKA